MLEVHLVVSTTVAAKLEGGLVVEQEWEDQE